MLVLLAVVALPVAGKAGSPPGAVERTIPLDLRTPTGLAWDGRSLWVADLDTATLNAVDPASGKVLRTLDAPGYSPMGLAWDGERLWVLDSGDATAYAVDPDSGLTVRALPLDSDTARGIAWDGTALWTVDARAGVISRLDGSDGTTWKSFSSPLAGRKGDEIGMVFTRGRLVVADRLSDTIYRIDPKEGVVLDSFPSPGPYPTGLAWDGDFDRCFFFDETGAFIEGYYLVGLLALASLRRSSGGVGVQFFKSNRFNSSGGLFLWSTRGLP